MTEMIVYVAPMRSPETIAATIRAGISNNSKIILCPNGKTASDKILKGISLVKESIITTVETEDDLVRVLIEKGE
jgi:hypothetical protein